SRMLWLSTLFGALGGAIGMLASYHLDIASGPVIVLTESLGFALAYATSAIRSALDGRRPSSDPTGASDPGGPAAAPPSPQPAEHLEGLGAIGGPVGGAGEGGDLGIEDGLTAEHDGHLGILGPDPGDGGAHRLDVG